MGTNQIMLILGALVILVTLQLSINAAIIRSTSTSLDGEATIDAMSMGQAMIDEIRTMAYDSIACRRLVTNPADFTPAAALGPDGDSLEYRITLDQAPFQSQIVYNDVDDYNGYTRIVASPRLGNFTVHDSVYYVTDFDQNTYSSTPTYFKKVIVTVTHPDLLYPVVMKSLVVYRRYFQ
jgi:hypothetical protein